ncbi:hypothetical protein FE257_000185 [Aspergillus nanangensis]|uniref:Glucose-methanol-choline oxidoreductase N-terminal domain-containing protein n=1 Tax=Aspergillus nanangensis TaxID=2582783 RepID=A0AAD4CZB3_ASPNN|nr:hypothetical protein FE257_000185 [Aspergillus nanangensis]
MDRAKDFISHQFDYLIVGGGTAGLAIAARLSERPDLTIGVIEAGPAAFDEPSINIPGRYGETLGTRYDWQFETTDQPGLAGRKLPCPRGKVLGGTSALNFMAWNRGNREDYDAWRELGNVGWGWEDVLPSFQKSETFHPPDDAHQQRYHSRYLADVHGLDGPLHTTHIREYGPSHGFWHATLGNLGVDTSPDSLRGSNIGAWNMVCTLDPTTQTRSYSASAYYLPVADRPNLVVLCEAQVLEVVIERDEHGLLAATGVCVAVDQDILTVPVSKEVIVCAGTIQSPQLLELSGIGAKAVLEPAGILIKVDNPNVGENLQDHLMTATIFEVDPSLTTPDDIKANPGLREAADRQHQSSQTGPWTVLPCSIAYCPLATFLTAAEIADLHTQAQQISTQTGKPRDRILARQFAPGSRLGQVEYLFDLGNWSPYYCGDEPGKTGKKKYGTMLQMLQYPFSRGSIHLPPRGDGNGHHSSSTSTDTTTPVINPKFFLGPGEIDFTVMKKAQEFTDRICSTQPLASIVRLRVWPPPPAVEEGRENYTDRDPYEEFVRQCTVTDWHPVGTCAMGGLEGMDAGVVDERLRVYGVRGLRVADASIMPLQVSAHPQATVYMIAEKAASMILEDAGYTLGNYK